MGEHHAGPRRGFTHWVSFRGQGNYYKPTLNINGEEVVYEDSAYVTDLLTDQAVEWLEKRSNDRPFFLYLSHKGVHADFQPALRHKGKYAGEKPTYPPTMHPGENED